MSRIVLLVGKASGGIGVHVRDLARGLRDLGHEVEVATHPVTARTFDLSVDVGVRGLRLLDDCCSPGCPWS